MITVDTATPVTLFALVDTGSNFVFHPQTLYMELFLRYVYHTCVLDLLSVFVKSERKTVPYVEPLITTAGQGHYQAKRISIRSADGQHARTALDETNAKLNQVSQPLIQPEEILAVPHVVRLSN